MKRLAKLQAASSQSSPREASPTPSTSSAPPKPKPKPIPAPTPKRVATVATPSPVPPKKKVSAPPKLDYVNWENDTITNVFKVTIDRNLALHSNQDIVWLRLDEDVQPMDVDNGGPPALTADRLESVVIARLDLDPASLDHDEDYRPFLSGIPKDQTVFEYLIGCWKRLNAAKSTLFKRGYYPVDLQKALELEEKMRHFIISYTGIVLMSPEAFPFPAGKAVGHPELVEILLSLSSFSTPLYGGTTESPSSLTPSEIEPFLQDLVHRFEPDNELESILGPVVESLLHHECLAQPDGIASTDSQWRGIIAGLEALVSNKAIAQMVVRMESWNPPDANAVNFERLSLMGPLLRLNVFPGDWPRILKTYFSEMDSRPAVDVESARNSLRGTLKSLQSSLFKIFNTIVRTSPECREAFLRYISRIISLNVKRAGMQIDRIDPRYYAHSSRIDVREETRINATSEEATQWEAANRLPEGVAPSNFISDIFYLALAMNHYGYQKTLQTFDEYSKQIDEDQRHLTTITGDRSWEGTPFQARMEAAIKQVKDNIAALNAMSAAASTQLLDPEVLFRGNSFNSFVATWLVRFADPKKTHPKPVVDLPLPTEVPLDFRVLPEYLLEDSIGYYVFVVRHNAPSLELSGREELLNFALTFLMSTWYIKNPFLKAKIVEVLFFGCIKYYRNDSASLLGSTLNSHPMALKYLMPALMHFYIEVEQTGASSQFYDKFNARRNITYVLKAVWGNQDQRKALKEEAKNVDKFVRFANLMINDVTYLMDESLSDLAQIFNIQKEMENRAEWASKPMQYRREREGLLRSMERQATGYTQLGKSTVDLLKLFTAETKEPFMMPEIIDRLAAMLDYNLDALVGPKCRELNLTNKEKYSFNPRQLLSDVVQVYLNLSEEGDFVKAIAGDGRSYKKELFDKAASICLSYSLKSPTEIEQLRIFVVKVEEAKAIIEAEEELGEVPDEFLDPLMFTVMRDPVTLPTSRAVIDRSTIKSHLLSDSTDPFNRMPLKIEDVIPNPELKERIQTFLVERRNKHAALDKPEEDAVKMNVD
ncbi:hypothetical protein EW146_g1184 [Bondarzewia mesenterica]|uniref:RING-type E3 ubiquitin transferase n=1 Tax=Bondarzewia mesenterica TaxID=1095465 RepID=A0A4S4M4K5_9AGAM|nr:hypothetical protein EW146_g1184 [Bondarzewia mesenterica]